MHQLIQRIGRVVRKTDEKSQSLIYVIYVDDTKDKDILNLVRTSLQSNHTNKKPINQDKISSYFQSIIEMDFIKVFLILTIINIKENESKVS